MNNKFKTIESIVASNLCVGCGACAQVVPDKIALEMDGGGYLRPRILSPLDEREQSRGVEVCPGVEVRHAVLDSRYDDVWGPLFDSRIGWSTNSELRHSASSGGALTAIATYLLVEGKVDAVLHIGVSEDEPLRNEFHISTTATEVAARAGSRYAPGAPLLGLRYAVSEHKRIAFIGKPCDVVALRKMAAADTLIGERVILCLSFMCAGVPSINGTHAVLRKMGVSSHNVAQFRYRGNGWPGLATAIMKNGDSRSMTYEESWGSILNRHLQFRCKICADGTGEFADITCADAWFGTSDGYPSFEEQLGRSLILARTDLGNTAIREAASEGYLKIEPLAHADIERMQPYQASRKRAILSRLVALLLFGKRIPRYNFVLLFRLAQRGGFSASVRNFAGMAKRLFRTRDT